MTAALPAAFLARMRHLLGDEEYEAYIRSYDEKRYYGLRSNPLKLAPGRLKELADFTLQPVPWAREGFYYGEGDRPGKHPYYHAGLYYIQEPSAMLPAELLNVVPGDRVLDLCAAPGGKTTQLAGRLNGSGLIVANDNSLDRARVLAKNVELFGIRNAMVMHEAPERLAQRWAGRFNKILIDAPCSGEGMFRKDEDMIRQWEKHSAQRCRAMQEPILQSAARLLASGGRMVYSTCTFSPEENEAVIAAFLRAHPRFRVVPAEASAGFVHGRPDWAAFTRGGAEPDWAELQTAGALRLWPHRIRGEGHFAVILEKDGREEEQDSLAVSGMATGLPEGGLDVSPVRRERRKPGAAAEGASLAPWEQFCREMLLEELPGKPVLFGEHLYLAMPAAPSVEGLKTVRPGWFAGIVKRGRFEPSHALALGLTAESAARVLRLDAGSEAAGRYLKGETLFVEERELSCAAGCGAKGYVLVCIDGFPLGWGKWAQGVLKNEYPPGWRRV